MAKFGKESLVKRSPVVVPEPPTKETTEAEQLAEEIKNITTTNSKILTNNKYKEILLGINIDSVDRPVEDIDALRLAKSTLIEKVNSTKRIISGETSISDTCRTCGQPIDNTHRKAIIAEAKSSL